MSSVRDPAVDNGPHIGPATTLSVSAGVVLDLREQPCALCGGRSFEVLARQDRHLLGLTTVGCLACGLVQTNPRPMPTDLESFYARHYRKLYQGVVAPDARYVEQFRKDQRLRRTARHLIDTLRLSDDSAVLDYGCGEGSLFAAMREAGFLGRLHGIEPNPDFARYAARNGQAVIHPTTQGLQGFDAVLLNHVLEHLPDPLSTLRDLRARLAPTGWLYIDVPDADRYASVSDLHLAHLLHFTKRTLVALVRTAGFEVDCCEQHDPPYHPLSLRLRARPLVGVHPSLASHDASAEAATWQRLRRLHRHRWRWILERRLSQNGALRAVWRSVRGFVRRRPTETRTDP